MTKVQPVTTKIIARGAIAIVDNDDGIRDKKERKIKPNRTRNPLRALKQMYAEHHRKGPQSHAKEIGCVDDVVEVKGERIGQYSIEKHLGAGGYGDVFLGRTTVKVKTGPSRVQRVAIKIQDKSQLKPSRRLKRVSQEIGLLRAHSRHPNIIGFHEKINTNDNVYIVMEKATMDLSTLVLKTSVFEDTDQKDLPQQVMLGILNATTYLHERGIAHLDLKPCNVLVQTSALDRNNRFIPGRRIEAISIKLCDFGMARVSRNYKPRDTKIDSRSKSGQGLPGKHAVWVNAPFGTRGYQAPEMFNSKYEGGWYDGRLADNWSVGCILAVVAFKTLSLPRESLWTTVDDGEEEAYLKILLRGFWTVDPTFRTPSNRGMKNRWFKKAAGVKFDEAWYR